jgi:hypothetical protein
MWGLGWGFRFAFVVGAVLLPLFAVWVASSLAARDSSVHLNRVQFWRLRGVAFDHGTEG